MDYQRQQDIFNPMDFTWPFHVVGQGGIGSAAGLVIAKLGIPEIHLWDDDILEEGNIPSQLIFGKNEIGKSKVESAVQILANHTEANIVTHKKVFVPKKDFIEGVVISGVHSMEKDEHGRPGRLDIWEALKYNTEVPLYLDGRLGGEILELYAIRPCILGDIELYEEYLFPDSEAAPLPCTARAVIYPAVILSGLIAATITRWARNEKYARRVTYDPKTGTFLSQF